MLVCSHAWQSQQLRSPDSFRTVVDTLPRCKCQEADWHLAKILLHVLPSNSIQDEKPNLLSLPRLVEKSQGLV